LSGPGADIRNQVSFHYKDEDNLIETSFHNLGNSEPWDFYLGNTLGNTFYLGSETVISRSVIAVPVVNQIRTYW
jgi:hypothetical protein